MKMDMQDGEASSEKISVVINRVVPDIVRSALEQQGKEFQKSMSPFLQQLSALTEAINGLNAKVAVMMDRSERMHNDPCRFVEELGKKQSSDVRDIHTKIDKHRQEEHRADSDFRNNTANTWVQVGLFLVAIAAVVVAVYK